MECYTEIPTVIEAEPFDCSADAESLRQAMQGIGTSKQRIINILAHRSNDQRQLIRETYNLVFERDLVDDLKSGTRFHFKEVLIALMSPMPLYLAQALNNALHGRRNNNILIEILCTRDKSSIESIKEAYMDEYGTELKDDLNSLPSPKFRKFLITMIKPDRSDVIDDLQVAKYLSQKLFDSSAGKSGIPIEDELMRIITKFSYPMLRLTFREYFKMHNNQFQNVIDTEFPEDLKDFIKTVYKSIMSPAVFFAKELNSAVAGLGTDDTKLIRLIVSRCEIDMENIKEEYKKLYCETLEQAVESDTSRYYKKLLMALIKSQPSQKTYSFGSYLSSYEFQFH